MPPPNLFSELEKVRSTPDDPQLTEEDKQILQRHVEYGQPLYKVLKSALDYADYLKEHIVAAQLVAGHPELEQARQLQLKRVAILEFLDFLSKCIRPTPSSPRRQG